MSTPQSPKRFSHSELRRFLGRAAGLLLTASLCGVVQAQDQVVSIDIRGPDPQELEESERADLSKLRGKIMKSFEDALWGEFDVLEAVQEMRDSQQALYDIDLEIRAPDQGCHWQVACYWSKKGPDAERHRCWYPHPMVSYCAESTVEELEESSCLGELLDFTATDDPPRPPRDLCQAPQAPKYKIVYTRCFKVVGFEDPTWAERIKGKAQRIPVQIEAELDKDFRTRGFDIEPADCPQAEGTDGNTGDFEVEGWIDEILDKEEDRMKLTIELYVRNVSGAEVPDALSPRTTTLGIARNRYTELGQIIVDHFRERLGGVER